MTKQSIVKYPVGIEVKHVIHWTSCPEITDFELKSYLVDFCGDEN